jgi:hypothetical protein
MKIVSLQSINKFSIMLSAFAGLMLALLAPVSAMASPGQILALHGPGIASSSAKVDLVALETKIGETDALNFIAKLRLKLGIDSLKEAFGQFHKGESNSSLRELRGQYEEFLYTTAAKLREGDPKLARELVMSRDEIYQMLANPEKLLASPVEQTEQ